MKSYDLKKIDKFIIYIWIILGVIFFFQFVMLAHLIEALLTSLVVLVLIYSPVTYLSKTLLRQAIQKKKMTTFVFQFLFYSLVTAAIMFGILRLCYYLEYTGVIPKSQMFQSTCMQNLISSLLTSCFINFGFCGLRFYEENLRLQKILVDSQLEILHAQINPHFMFNVLNHIHVLMQKDVERASDLLLNYSDILRYQLYNGKKEKVYLEKEIEFLKSYIAIEKVRWNEKINIVSNFKIIDSKQSVAPLIFIPFIENAFKHVSRSNFEKGYIQIDFEQNKNILEMNVKNSKSTVKKEKQEDSGIGLENTRQRLNILYPEKYELKINENETEYHSHLIIYI